MKIAVLPGDGIGPEVTAQGVKVLKAVLGERHSLELHEASIGGAGFDAEGDSLPPATLQLAYECDAILHGASGVAEDEKRLPQKAAGFALLRLRKALNLFANLRPAFMFPELIGSSTLKREVVDGLDLLILRELNGDVYYGEPRGIDSTTGFNTMRYAESEVERIGHVAFQLARKRRKKVCSVDKANVLETSALWRRVMIRIGREYPDVELSHMLVDAAAMMLVRNPKQFDVMVTGNIFGDILSDEAGMLTGSIGMLPSASLGNDANGTGKKGLYEPVHGSAPDIAGKDIANPLASILSVAMMLRYSFDLEEHALRIERAVREVLRKGYRTADILEPGTRRVGTEEMGEAVVAAIRPV
jgi:3-isopropylmalate dehydrogenase